VLTTTDSLAPYSPPAGTTLAEAQVAYLPLNTSYPESNPAPTITQYRIWLVSTPRMYYLQWY